MRYIFLAILCYILFRLIKALFPGSGKGEMDVMPFDKRPDEDEMVKDPYCKLYIPKKDAYQAKINGESLYFCSRECIEKYKEGRV